jgi:hypothetical protein
MVVAGSPRVHHAARRRGGHVATCHEGYSCNRPEPLGRRDGAQGRRFFRRTKPCGATPDGRAVFARWASASYGYHQNGSTRYAAGATIAARVLSIKALTSACSAAGTENLSRVVCTSSMNACHSPGVIAISRWDSSMLRPE